MQNTATSLFLRNVFNRKNKALSQIQYIKSEFNSSLVDSLFFVKFSNKQMTCLLIQVSLGFN